VLNVAVTPAGKPEALRLTLLANPFFGVSVIVDVPLAPCLTDNEAGEAPMVKLGAAFTVNVTVDVAVV
jgi:hypothetical protein